MNTLKLGRTDITVSDWCLGTMTYGTHTLDDDAHRQIDMCLDAGINFIDCAEMYPVNPVLKETAGMSEDVLGRWFAKTGRRDEVVLATKVSGAGNAKRGEQGYDSKTVKVAVEESLRRMQTDYIDLYQLHWPNRGSYHFRQCWSFDPSRQNRAETIALMEDTLCALKDLVDEGKLRAIGLSNESAWGTTKWVDVAEQMGAPRVATMQNEYSLLCRLYDTDMAEMSVNEDVTLISYSPLACGLLTGKYQNGARPEGSRLAINGTLGGRATDRAFEATQAYLDIAEKHGLACDHMAMAWQRHRPFPISSIFGTTNVAQLEHLLKGKDLTLNDDVLADIEAAHKQHPMPY